MAMIFIDEVVVMRAPHPEEPKRNEEPKRGDYVTRPDEPLVLNPDERWVSYVVYPIG
jgi:hypothetical protein